MAYGLKTYPERIPDWAQWQEVMYGDMPEEEKKIKEVVPKEHPLYRILKSRKS